MNWIAIATGITRDPSVVALAEALGVSVPTTTGHVVGVLTCLPEGADTGDLSAVSDKTLEQWALWSGKRGKFATAFRAHLCDAQGVVRAWENWNGRQQQRLRADRDRKREEREARRVQRTSDGPSAGRPQTKRGASTGRPALHNRTEQDRTTTSAAAAADVVAGGSGAAWIALHFPDAGHQHAAACYLRAHQYPDAMRATLTAIASGQGAPNGQPVPWDTIGRALVEMQGAGARFTPNALRGFLTRLTEASAAVTWDDIARDAMATAPEVSDVA